MITAKEAKMKAREALLQPSLKKHMDCIERCISVRVRQGKMHTEICMDFSEDNADILEDLKTAICNELESLGYSANFGYLNYLTIDWDWRFPNESKED